MSTRWSAFAAGASRWSAALDEERRRPHDQRQPRDGGRPVARGPGCDGRTHRVRYLPVCADRAPAAGRGVRTRGRNGSIAYTRARGEHRVAHAGPGVFITLEGPDGSGKSSLLRRAGARPCARPAATSSRRASPARRRSGEQVRRLVLDTEPQIDRTGPRRRAAVRGLARPARRRGHPPGPRARRRRRVRPLRRLVARLPGRGLRACRWTSCAAVQRFATGGLVPDLTILLDLPVEAGLARKSAEVTRFEAYHDVAYHERVRAAFLGVRGRRAGALRDRRRDARRGGRPRRGDRGARPAGAARPPCLRTADAARAVTGGRACA